MFVMTYFLWTIPVPLFVETGRSSPLKHVTTELQVTASAVILLAMGISQTGTVLEEQRPLHLLVVNVETAWSPGLKHAMTGQMTLMDATLLVPGTPMDGYVQGDLPPFLLLATIFAETDC